MTILPFRTVSRTKSDSDLWPASRISCSARCFSSSVTRAFSHSLRSWRLSLRGLPAHTRGCKGASPCRGFCVTETLLAIDKSIGIWGESSASQLTFTLINYAKYLVT